MEIETEKERRSKWIRRLSLSILLVHIQKIAFPGWLYMERHKSIVSYSGDLSDATQCQKEAPALHLKKQYILPIVWHSTRKAIESRQTLGKGKQEHTQTASKSTARKVAASSRAPWVFGRRQVALPRQVTFLQPDMPSILSVPQKTMWGGMVPSFDQSE